MTKRKAIFNGLPVYAALFAAVFMLLLMLSAAPVNAEDTDNVKSLSITWQVTGGEITARYDYASDSFTYKKWDTSIYDYVDVDTQLPDGVSYDRNTGILTLENAAIKDIFYRGTKDLKVYIAGTSSFGLLRADDGREAVTDPETGKNTGEYECYHGGDIIIYGDGKKQSTLNYDWIWQETSAGSPERIEPDADDGDVIIRDLTLNGNLIEAAISNLTIDSCNVVLTKNADGDSPAISAGGSPSEYANPEGVFTVKDSVIEIIGGGSFRAFDFVLNGEFFYVGSEAHQVASEANLENNYYKNQYGYYGIYGYPYYLITPEEQKILTDISNANITLNKSTFTYNGKAQTPEPTVVYEGTTLRKGADYTVAYEKNINAGTGTVAVTGTGDFKGTIKKTFTIGKAANTMAAAGKTATVKAKKLKKRAQTIEAAKAVTVANAKGTVTYKLNSVSKAKYKKYFKVNTAGKITVKKKLKKGTYKLNISVTASGNGNFNPVTKQVTVKIKVK